MAHIKALKKTVPLAVVWLLPMVSWAQEPSTRSLDELLNAKVEIATRHGTDWALRWVPISLPATLVVGGGLYQDSERSVDLENRGGLREPSDPAQRFPQKRIVDGYGYIQCMQQLGTLGLTAGDRYQDGELGTAFAPRLGLTYEAGSLNAKLLCGEAFRTPNLPDLQHLLCFQGLPKT